MNIQVIAELLSALAAFVTVGMACIELYSRSSSKKAETAIDIYAEFLFVNQQLQYAIRNIYRLLESSDTLTDGEIKAFAKTHIIDAEIISKIQKIENTSITNSNYTTEQGKVNSTHILDFIGNAINLIVNINTFYAMVMENEIIDIDNLKEKATRIFDEYEKLDDSLKQTEIILNKNLKKLHNSSNMYLLLLFALSIVFIVLCVFL